ncbi:MAG: glycerate kinase [Verrucomicrobia subdivision 3 bacterium]|nr:glycerate kinase [Limisphaerales bacterium]
MTLSILIAPDKFKGTLTATQAAKAIAIGWKSARPEDTLTQLPISDGGDGFGELMAEATGAGSLSIETEDADHAPTVAPCWVVRESGTAIVESANIIGLTMLAAEKRRPINLNSCGLGIVLRNEQFTGCRQHIIGIGGSATNDGGFGMARELGWGFEDDQGRPILGWIDLVNLKKIHPPKSKFTGESIVAVDVQNPLLGPTGCTQIFGPQKGLRKEDIPKAEAALGRLAAVWESQTGEDAAGLPGAGAAGGLGFGLHCFAGATIRSGFEIFAEAVGLETLLRAADVVITGEGAMDRQSVMGKGVGELAKRARANGCRCLGLAGQVEDRPALADYLDECRALTDFTTTAEAETDAARRLEKLSREVADGFCSPAR